MAFESSLTQRGDSSRFETQGQTPNQGEGDGRRNDLTASSGRVNLRAREPATAAATNENWMKEITTTMQFNQRPVPTFKERTCVEYGTFKDNFEKHVRAGNITDSRKLELLISAYSGSAKQDLHGCNRYADPTEGYQQAWLIRNDRHGNQRKYIQFLMREVMYGPNLSLEDIEGLRTFRNNLSSCVNNLKQFGALNQVDAYEIMHIITDRFTGEPSTDYEKEMDYWEEANGKIESEADESGEEDGKAPTCSSLGRNAATSATRTPKPIHKMGYRTRHCYLHRDGRRIMIYTRETMR
ncbi:hypothetical protein E2C01_048499 [Portunus trituberculatus]|uniref:Uncharacterized protein n=1 Tax=Portunus trituberculatus TaxID=210409 RepID=A0A5B7GBS9_PORTR|nr:hypothetical protein [Portunus trituberculatus]